MDKGGELGRSSFLAPWPVWPNQIFSLLDIWRMLVSSMFFGAWANLPLIWVFFFVGRVRVSMKIRSWLKSCSVHLTLVLKVSSLVQLLTAVVLWLNWLLWYLFGCPLWLWEKWFCFYSRDSKKVPWVQFYTVCNGVSSHFIILFVSSCLTLSLSQRSRVVTTGS